MAKNISCSYRGPKLGYQHQGLAVYNPSTQVDTASSAELYRQCTQKFTHIHKNLKVV